MALVIDADGHIFEPNEIWEKYLDPAFRSRAPRLIVDEQGRQVYEYEGRRSHTGPELGPPEGFIAAQSRPGGTDPQVRLKDMDVQGIDIAVLFPMFGFTPSGWSQDPELATAVCRAYNDWLHDYCQADPSRLKGLPILPLVDVNESVRELRRAVTELGFVGAIFPGGALGKLISDEYFYPIWEAAQDLNVPVLAHSIMKIPGTEVFSYQYLPCHTLGFPYDAMVSLMMTMYGGLLEEFPRLRFGFTEAGCGWLPYWIDRMTEHYEWRAKEVPKMKHSPREYLESGRVFVACEAEESTLECVVQHCGEDAIVFASDYPHWDADMDAVHELKSRTGLSESARTKILGGNANRLFGWS